METGMTEAGGARLAPGKRLSDMRQFYMHVKSCTPCGCLAAFVALYPLRYQGVVFNMLICMHFIYRLVFWQSKKSPFASAT
jgi:hypothetical protein